MSKIKPIIKDNNKYLISSWIIEKFPEDYQKMRYIEPYVGNGSILLNKEKSIEEVAGDPNLEIINLWKVIKDEYKILNKKLSKLSYSEKTFKEIKKNEKEYLQKAIVELVTRRLSKNENKELYNPLDKKNANDNWKQLIKSLEEIHNRISQVYFLSKSPKELISSFDNEKTFCFCSPSNIDKNNNNFIDVCEQLKTFRGKVVFFAENSSMYKRIFSGWKSTKNKNKKNIIWYNF